MELLQYIIIGILTIGAFIFLFKKFRNSFKADCSSGGCATSCSSSKPKNKEFQ